MPIPDRPVDAAEIATEWGQEIHDRTFAPKGTSLVGAGVSAADNTEVAIPITGVTQDPGGWYDSGAHLAEVPPDAEGLYLMSALFATDDLDETASCRCYIHVNGALTHMATEAGQGGTAIQIPVNGHLVLAAGDQITVTGRKIGTAGGAVIISLVNLSLIRVGSEYGA